MKQYLLISKPPLHRKNQGLFMGKMLRLRDLGEGVLGCVCVSTYLFGGKKKHLNITSR